MRTTYLRTVAVLAFVAASATACISPASDGGAQPANNAGAAPSASARTPDTGTQAAIPSATASPSATPPAATGVAYFMSDPGDPVTISTFSGGAVAVAVILPADPTGCTSNTVSVSPDGAHIAWVQGGADGEEDGTLVAADIHGTHHFTLATGVSCFGPVALRWPSATEVEGERGDKRLDFHVTTGKPVAGDPGTELLPLWSVDGKAIVADDAHGDLFAGLVAAGAKHKITYTPPAAESQNWHGWSPRAVSLDARYVAIGWIGGDPGRQDDSFAVLDVATSKPVTLPSGGGPIEFLIDGTVLVESYGTPPTLDILDAGFHKLSSTPVPIALSQAILLRYVP